jgi:hypothetical protein
MLKFLARRGCEDMPIILAGDFKVNVKDNYNTELVEFMKDTYELDVLSVNPKCITSCFRTVLPKACATVLVIPAPSVVVRETEHFENYVSCT